MRRPPLLLLLLLVLAAGCSGTSDPPPVATTTTLLPPEAPTSTAGQPTTTTTPSFETPAVIDLPYVQRVLETIYRLDGDATRHAYAKKVPDAELNERLDAIFADPVLAGAKNVISQNAAEGFTRFANPPGDPIVRAVAIVQATTACMVVRADLDHRPTYKDSLPKEPQAVIQLIRAPVVRFNTTGWGVIVAGDPDPGTNIKVCA